MKSIKNVAVILFALCIETASIAGVKVIERSDKIIPEWIQVSKTNNLIANGTGLTLDQAKSKAFDSLRNYVLTVAAEQMKIKNAFFKQKNLDHKDARELFKKSVYYSDFDATCHDGFYWEKLKDMETKSKVYNYYLRHCINEDKMEKAINEIALDYKLTNTLDSMKIQFSEYNTVQDLNEINTKLMFLNARFSDNDLRKTECEELLAKVEDDYRNIEVKEILHVPGKLIVCQALNDRAVHSSKQPMVESTSAMITKIENHNEQWIIHYRYFSIGNPASDVISVEFDNLQNKKSGDFKINMNEENLDVRLSGGPIIIKSGKMIKVYLVSTYTGDAVVERIILRYNNLDIANTKINQQLKGTGFYTIRYLTPPGFYKVNVGNKVSGELHLIAKKTGQKEIYRFYNQQLALQ